MARGGVYKTEIQQARDSLVAQGKHPSIDAIRVALGNTGSKATIHRYLKELEAEEGQGAGAKVAISDALQDLVAKLAARLHEEADTVISEAKTAFDSALRERTQELERHRVEATSLADQLRRTESDLQAERTAHALARDELAQATVTRVQLEERILGVSARLVEQETHTASLEEKHRNARDALEHFRAATKEQRDQDQRRHEHQVQGLQVELRKAADALTGKNQEIVQLSRDNGRLMEQIGRAEREIGELRSEARQHAHELQALRPLAQEVKALEARAAHEIAAGERLRAELSTTVSALQSERLGRTHAELEVARGRARLEAIEQIVARLGKQPVHDEDQADDQRSLPLPEPSN